MLALVRRDEICRRLMSAPGVGPLVAITFKTAIDDPARIRKSKGVGALLGLTPRKYQSGETDVTGHVSCVGDMMARTALYEAANAILSRITRFSALKRWGMDVAKRRGRRGPRGGGPQTRRHFASDVGRRNELSLDKGDVAGSRACQRVNVAEKRIRGGPFRGLFRSGSRRRDDGEGEAVRWAVGIT